MKKSYILLIALLSLFSSILLFAQQTTIGTPWQGERGINVTVAEMMAWEKSNPVVIPPGIRYKRLQELENERDDLDQNPLAPAVSSWPPLTDEEKRNLPTGLFSPQTVGLTFLGTQSSESGYVPPDVMGDVGPTQILIHSNGVIKVFDKSGTVGSLNVTDNTFWSSVRNGQDVSDPHIRYDRLTGRWFICIINLPASGANRILIAVSSGSTITNTSSFTFFQFQQDQPTPTGDTGYFADYPTLGVDANALYIGANMFLNVSPYSFKGSSAFVVRKSALLSGSLVVTAFRQLNDGSGSGLYTPQGVNNDDSTATEGYFIGVDNASYSQLDIRRVSTPGGTPTMSSDITVTVPTTTAPILQVVKGSASNRRLDALEDRLYAAMIKKNKLTGLTSLWTAHNIEVNSSGVGTSGGGRNGSRWYEITNLTTTPTLRQSGTLFSSASSSPVGYWIPSVAMSGQGHMALGCSYASTNDYASVAVAGRLGTDALGTTQTVTNAFASSTAYNAEAADGQRWGDYSQTVVDPTDDMTMWTFQEYCNATSSWAVRAVKLVAPPPATPSSASPAAVNTGATNVSVTITGTSSSGSGFFDPGAGFSNRIAATVNGGGVTVNSITFTGATSITLNLTVAPGAAPGARTVTVTNPDGQTATSATGILTINNVSCPTITLSPSGLPAGSIHIAYSQSITASGGTSPYTYSISSGTLPTGITLTSGGLLAGTPSQSGDFIITVTATDSNLCTGNLTDTLSIAGCPVISITPSTITGGTLNTPYSQSFSASGGTPSYTYSISGDNLPSGITFSSGGELSGTPTMAGNYIVTITATDGITCTGSITDTLSIGGCPSITLTPTTLPDELTGTTYNQTITANGGTAPYIYTVSSGAVPTGLTLSSGGTLTGTPTTVGTYTFTVKATDAANCFGTQSYTIQIANGNIINLTTSGSAYTQDFNTLALTGTSSTLPTGWQLKETGSNANTTYAADSGSNTAGNSYSYGSSGNTDRALGGILSGSLIPMYGAGFKNSTGGTITSLLVSYTGEEWRTGGGTGRTIPDTLKFQLSTSADSITTGTWTTYDSLRFLSPIYGVTAARLNGNSSANRTAKNYTISGLSIANGSTFFVRWNDVNVSGTDDGVAVDDFSITPYSSTSPTNPSITVTSTPDTVVRGNSTLLKATVTPGTNPTSTGLAVTANLSAIGGSASQTMFDDGTNGDVTIGDNIFSYTATVPIDTPAGTKSCSFSVTDAESRSGTANKSIVVVNVACPTITLSPSSLPAGINGTAYSQTVTASGGTTPYSFAVTSGTLPTGLSLSSGGSLTGTPSADGSFSFTVTATDSNGCSGSKAYSITVTSPAATISLTAISTAYTQSFNTLASTGTSAAVPTGWLLSESGTSGNTSYTAGTGSSNTGDTYSFGAASDTDRAFGGLQSGSVIPTIGAGFTNNTGSTVVSLQLNYTGEQWRLGAQARKDSLIFQFSTDAANLTSGTWTNYHPLDFITPNDTTTAGAINGNGTSNKTAVGYLLTGLSLANGSSFFIRWNDANISGSDDGLSVDDFSITPYSSGVTPTNPAITGSANPSTVAAGSTVILRAVVTPGTNPASTGLSVTGNLSAIGGSSAQAFYDDGTNGDTTQSDNIFTFTASIPTLTPAGSKTINLSVSDAQSRSAAGSFSLTVTPYSCPTIKISPSTLPSDTAGQLYSQTISAIDGTAPYTFTVTAGSLPKGLTLSSGGVLSGTPDSAAAYSFTITATDNNLCTANKNYSITITPGVASPSVAIQAFWNIVSNPVIAQNDSVRVLYPSSTSSAFAFLPLGGYQLRSVLENGAGYWLKFPSATNVTITGTALLTDTVDVISGWNLVGSISVPLKATLVSSIPPGIQTGAFYQYNNGYVTADTLYPGKGYWIKVSSDGKLILSATSSLLAANRIHITPNSELPPQPPTGEISSDDSAVPAEFALEQNYPNPFNPTTNFGIRIAEAGIVTLKVYDVLGREVAAVLNQEMAPGVYNIPWNASGLTSGIYYYKMTASPHEGGKTTPFSDMKKLLLMK